VVVGLFPAPPQPALSHQNSYGMSTDWWFCNAWNERAFGEFVFLFRGETTSFSGAYGAEGGFQLAIATSAARQSLSWPIFTHVTSVSSSLVFWRRICFRRSRIRGIFEDERSNLHQCRWALGSLLLSEHFLRASTPLSPPAESGLFDDLAPPRMTSIRNQGHPLLLPLLPRARQRVATRL